MSIVIGCSGSTGSSLLKTLLNRHPQLFAGPEANLFAYPQVYHNWAYWKKYLLTDIKTDGWQLTKGMQLLQPAFGWSSANLRKVISDSPSFSTFVNQFFSKPLIQNGKQKWVAKTPANAMGMADYIRQFPEGHIIQTVRNPYDTIASLMARGMNVWQATGYYVYNTAIATSNWENDRYFHLKYEDLTIRPKQTLQTLFEFLQLPFEDKILIAQHEKRNEPSSMPGWKNEETGAVVPSSVGRFAECEPEQQELIKVALARFQISDFYQKKYNIFFKNGMEICAHLGYDYWEIKEKKYDFLLRKYIWRDRFGRVKHGFWEQFFHYPGSIL